jgi:hypothetical protein
MQQRSPVIEGRSVGPYRALPPLSRHAGVRYSRPTVEQIVDSNGCIGVGGVRIFGYDAMPHDLAKASRAYAAAAAA